MGGWACVELSDGLHRGICNLHGDGVQFEEGICRFEAWALVLVSPGILVGTALGLLVEMLNGGHALQYGIHLGASIRPTYLGSQPANTQTF